MWIDAQIYFNFCTVSKKTAISEQTIHFYPPKGHTSRTYIIFFFFYIASEWICFNVLSDASCLILDDTFANSHFDTDDFMIRSLIHTLFILLALASKWQAEASRKLDSSISDTFQMPCWDNVVLKDLSSPVFIFASESLNTVDNIRIAITWEQGYL